MWLLTSLFHSHCDDLHKTCQNSCIGGADDLQVPVLSEQLVTMETAGREKHALLRMWPLVGFPHIYGQLKLDLMVYH